MKAALKILTIALVAAAFACAPKPAQAKRAAPKEVAPVVHDGVRYTAPHWLDGKKQAGGYVQAHDTKSGKLLWEVRVYETKLDTRKERDVQDVFITSLAIDSKSKGLVVANERGKRFVVDLATRKVKQL